MTGRDGKGGKRQQGAARVDELGRTRGRQASGGRTVEERGGELVEVALPGRRGGLGHGGGCRQGASS